MKSEISPLSVAGTVLDFCGPDRMAKPEALAFLEEVVGYLEMSIEALRDEISEEEPAP